MAARLQDSAETETRLRWFVLATFLFGAVGTGSELVLIGHFEDTWQCVPLALLAFGLLVVAWQRIERGRRSTRVLQGAMLALVAGGLTGIWLHYDGNVEFELEMYPSFAGPDLIREALAGATPVLAPAALVQVGLLGLAYAYRHPFLARTRSGWAKRHGERRSR